MYYEDKQMWRIPHFRPTMYSNPTIQLTYPNYCILCKVLHNIQYVHMQSQSVCFPSISSMNLLALSMATPNFLRSATYF
jgi:hypothetical protein